MHSPYLTCSSCAPLSAQTTDILNTAVLTGKMVSVPVKTLAVEASGSVMDVTNYTSCRSTEEDVLKVRHENSRIDQCEQNLDIQNKNSNCFAFRAVLIQFILFWQSYCVNTVSVFTLFCLFVQFNFSNLTTSDISSFLVLLGFS